MTKALILFALLFATPMFAQHVYIMNGIADKYDVRYTVETCDDGTCSGKATIDVFNRGEKTSLQTVVLAKTEFMKEEAQNTVDQQSIVFSGDYNFDGQPDLAFRDGNHGAYGGPTYAIYVYNPASHTFIHDKALSKLTQTNLGMFTVDTANKMLVTENKSGCCIHIQESYTNTGNKLKKVKTVTEDASKFQASTIKVTTKTLVNGKWKTKVTYMERGE